MRYSITLPVPLQSPILMNRAKRALDEAVCIGPWITADSHGYHNVLDIGCGAALTSICLAKALKFERLWLMDGQQGSYTNGFKQDTRPWEDISRAHMIAEANLDCCDWKIIDPDSTLRGSFTFIMSLLSWGHHYPIEVYLDMVKASLIYGGRLVVDIRKVTRANKAPDGLKTLTNNGFRLLKQLDETKKCNRYVLERE